MSVQTEHYPLEIQLDLIVKNTQAPLKVRVISLALTRQDDEPIECCLSLQVSPQLYSQIDTKALFNLSPDLRNPTSPIEFLPEPDIAIEVTLKPDLLPSLIENSHTPEDAIAYLQHLSNEDPSHPLLSTESWLALSVKQQQASGEVGYRTVWSYITPEALTEQAFSNEALSEGITHFFQDIISNNL